MTTQAKRTHKASESGQDKLTDAKRQAQAQFDSIAEMVKALEQANLADDGGAEACGRVEDASQAIHEDALSVEVRPGWYVPGARDADTKPAEYCILLCTGGPAVRIIGELSEHGEPETARLECQDWFQPWTEVRPLVSPDNYNSEPVLLAYARCFWFGE